MRAFVLCCAALVAVSTARVQAQGEGPAPLSLLDVPFISQSEALCGGAAAAMVLRYWGEREITAETFAHLMDRSAAGIRTDALTGELARRGWTAIGLSGSEASLRAELTRGRPVLTLIEDRPATFHYVVMLGWHDRGVIFHDPARGPFVVMSTKAFEERWDAARRWMAVVLPATARNTPTGTPPAPAPPNTKPDACQQTVADGVRLAQANDVGAAERVLAAAVSCPAATRELAGIRVTQKRWVEAEDLAAAAIAAGDADPYAWKVLATSRFVQNNRTGALDAWNEAGEPRLDLVRVDGLVRTRHRVIEQMLDVRSGELLTAESFARARRKLSELPVASATRLDYVPVSGGLAELRGVVSELPIVPRGRLELAAMGVIAAATREVTLNISSATGGGERVWAGWRFWPHRMRVAGGVEAPAPWGGIWAVDAFSERQPFTDIATPAAERVSAQMRVGDWVTSRMRWNASTGIDEWNDGSLRPRLAGAIRYISLSDRLDMDVTASIWPGDAAFSTTSVSAAYRSSMARRGMVWTAGGHAGAATVRAPLDIWSAGDTGHARRTLLRAHPVLDEGRLRVDRLGRGLIQGSAEFQYWHRAHTLLDAGAALFTDVARTANRYAGPSQTDVDVGAGVRFVALGMSGTFRVDVARGLRDGNTILSAVYQP
jgi:predicted double-glycine peptidase